MIYLIYFWYILIYFDIFDMFWQHATAISIHFCIHCIHPSHRESRDGIELSFVQRSRSLAVPNPVNHRSWWSDLIIWSRSRCLHLHDLQISPDISHISESQRASKSLKELRANVVKISATGTRSALCQDQSSAICIYLHLFASLAIQKLQSSTSRHRDAACSHHVVIM